jgi:Ca2+-binding EF-hand superfamily protein
MFQSMFHTERAGECLRARIAKRPHFTLDNAFSYCDKNRDGAITSNDIRDTLAEHGFFATEKEIGFIMYKFDKDRDQKIGYSEFIQEMTPKNAI